MSPFLFQCVVVAACLGQGTQPGDYQRSLLVGTLERTYFAHVSRKYDPERPTPVVVVLHGLGMTGQMMLDFGIRRKSDSAGFIAVCPDGAVFANCIPFWNCGGIQIDESAKADDVAFMGQLLDAVEKWVNVDRRRVYVIGLSNGGMMAHRLAIELPDRIAAIATVAGTFPTDVGRPKCPMPVIHFHGTCDRLVPFNGVPKENEEPLARFGSAEGTAAVWAAANGCVAAPQIEVLENKKIDDGMKITRKTYGPGKAGTEVILYVIEGGGHTWPGEPPPIGLLGKSTHNISATDLIWEFFERHPKPCDGAR